MPSPSQHSFFMYKYNSWYKMKCTRLIGMPTVSANSRTITRLSAKTISWTLSMFSSFTADFRVPGRAPFLMLVLPRLNSSLLLETLLFSYSISVRMTREYSWYLWINLECFRTSRNKSSTHSGFIFSSPTTCTKNIILAWTHLVYRHAP